MAGFLIFMASQKFHFKQMFADRSCVATSRFIFRHLSVFLCASPQSRFVPGRPENFCVSVLLSRQAVFSSLM